MSVIYPPGYLPLATEVNEATGKRRLTREYRIVVDGELYTIPKGFETDLSSYPQWASWIVRFSKVDTAGVVHDYLYEAGKVSRAKADRIWRKLAVHGDHSANLVQGWVSWLGLRMGGWLPWLKYRRAKPA